MEERRNKIRDGIREPIGDIVLGLFREDVDGDKAIEDLISFIEQELDRVRESTAREVIDRAYMSGLLEGTMHHWGLKSMEVNGYEEKDEILKDYLN